MQLTINLIFSYDAGIQTFDTANVCFIFEVLYLQLTIIFWTKVYSNGLSEIILGNAIKQFNFLREELVIMTKVR